MRIKTYIAPTMTAAMKQIRKELGDEAVIVSTIENSNEVRVTAALEDQDTLQSHGLTGGATGRVPGLELICDRLELHNMPMDLSETLIEHCSHLRNGNIAERLVSGLSKVFKFAPLPTFTEVNTPALLVGPPGVGKTITIARLALLASLKQQNVHVITADTQKAGAVAQISSFTKALSVSLSTASSQSELAQALEEVPKGATLLIDTPGINPFKQDEMRHLAEIILAVRVSPVLVLPAGGDAVEQQEMIDSFSTLGASRLILTKMDLCRRLGGLLSAIHNTRIQMMAYSNSPLVANPLEELTPEKLALLLLDDLASIKNALESQKESAS